MRLAIAAILITLASPAQAGERITFDHRAYPALNASMEARGDKAVYFENSWPRQLLDRIVVRGKSPKKWDEALEIIVRPLRSASPADPASWLARFRQVEDTTCPSTWQVITQDADSITFSRRAAGCKALAGQERIYRVLLGRDNAFLLAALYRGNMDEPTRRQWLTLLASAHIER